jgi:hypothetical protein
MREFGPDCTIATAHTLREEVDLFALKLVLFENSIRLISLRFF